MSLGSPTPEQIAEARLRAEQQPDAVQHRVKYAELLRLSGRTEDSAAEYRTAARAYAVQGDWLRAFAIARALLHLAPDDSETQRFVTSMYSDSRRAPKGGAPGHEAKVDQSMASMVDAPAAIALPGKERLPLDTSRFSEVTSLPIFDDLEVVDLEDISHQLRTVIVERGETIFREGEHSSGMFVILRGEVNVSVVDDSGQMSPLATLNEGGFCGEMSLMGQHHRLALVEAQTRTELLDVDVELFELLTERSATFLSELRRAWVVRRDENVVTRSSLLGRLPAEDRTRILGVLQPVTYRKREPVIRMGDAVDRICLLGEGRLQVYRRTEQVDKEVVATLLPGQFVPDPEVVAGEWYSVHVRALEASTVYWIPRDVLLEVVGQHPQLRGRMVSIFTATEEPPEAPAGARTTETRPLTDPSLWED